MSSSVIENKLKQAGFYISYRSKDELKLQSCPLHRDKTPSLSINLRRNAYQCFSCGDKGNINKLLSYFGLDYYYKPKIEEIELLLMDKQEQQDDVVPYSAEVSELKKYAFFHPYLLSRGFTKEFILSNKIGFDKCSARVTIPIFFNGSYYGCAKRTVINDIPKILYNSGMPKDKILYCPLTNTGNSEYLLVTEGPIDALKASMFGQDSISIMGCHASKDQMEFTKKLAKGRQVVLALDNDEPGRKGIQKWLSLTSDFDAVIFSYPNEVKDIGEISETEFNNGITKAKPFWE